MSSRAEEYLELILVVKKDFACVCCFRWASKLVEKSLGLGREQGSLTSPSSGIGPGIFVTAFVVF